MEPAGLSARGVRRRKRRRPPDAVHRRFKGFEILETGSLSPEEYDELRDTVNFLDYIGEPMPDFERRLLGMRVLVFLSCSLSHIPKKEFSKK